VTVDDNLATSRKPDDLPAFNREMLALFITPSGAATPLARLRSPPAVDKAKFPA
jgi:putative intracellular protease/amidase